ncbi:biotin transporter BioY [Eupransor demetentiae]|uniref:Biotin transporter n=1 Tax=Eupransor demetentiae TaxID=3109584 RepID=A0ABM9N3P4_9LACO|nr:Biotin transporter BioY (BioY) [Lactobacillaceae bacterium LMG 33000]
MMKNTKLQDLTVSAVFLALLIVLAVIPGIPLGPIPVPIVVQNLGIMLVAILLGAKRGTLVIATLLVMVLLGLPVLAGGRGGFAVLIGPSAGYLLGYLLMPAGYVLLQNFLRPLLGHWSFLLNFFSIWLANMILCYGFGVLWLHLTVKTPFMTALWTNLVMFTPGDLVKAFVAVVLAAAISRLSWWQKN